MFQEYFRQRNISIQKTIDSKQNHYLTIHSYISTQTNWRKYLPEETIMLPAKYTEKIMGTLNKIILFKNNCNSKFANDLIIRKCNSCDWCSNNGECRDGCMFKLKNNDYICIWLHREQIIMELYNNYVLKRTFRITGEFLNFNEEQIFSIMRDNLNLKLPDKQSSSRSNAKLVIFLLSTSNSI